MNQKSEGAVEPLTANWFSLILQKNGFGFKNFFISILNVMFIVSDNPVTGKEAKFTLLCTSALYDRFKFFCSISLGNENNYSNLRNIKRITTFLQ